MDTTCYYLMAVSLVVGIWLGYNAAKFVVKADRARRGWRRRI
jgi:uncharacterized membrane-anchored protein YhcB (DUF1043 family)